MSRQIVFRDGIFYDEKWNAINPTFDELMEITTAVYKYCDINIKAVL